MCVCAAHNSVQLCTTFLRIDYCKTVDSNDYSNYRFNFYLPELKER